MTNKSFEMCVYKFKTRIVTQAMLSVIRLGCRNLGTFDSKLENCGSLTHTLGYAFTDTKAATRPVIGYWCKRVCPTARLSLHASSFSSGTVVVYTAA